MEQGKAERHQSRRHLCLVFLSSVLHMADALASEISWDNEKVNPKAGMALGPWEIWTLLASIATDKDQQGMVQWKTSLPILPKD